MGLTTIILSKSLIGLIHSWQQPRLAANPEDAEPANSGHRGGWIFGPGRDPLPRRNRLSERRRQPSRQCPVKAPTVAYQLPERMQIVTRISDAVFRGLLGAVVPCAEHMV